MKELNDRQRIWVAFSIALGSVLTVAALVGCFAAVLIKVVATVDQFD